jgi:hypothetical protein
MSEQQSEEATMAISDEVEDDAHTVVIRLEDKYNDEPPQQLAIADDPCILVEKQIERAEEMIKCFTIKNDVVAEKEALLVDLDDDVQKVTLINTAIRPALAKGRVKPLFHALFLPTTFLENRLSLSGVTAGCVDEERNLRFKFLGNNLNEVVDEDTGRGAGIIFDDGLKNNWEFSCEEADFAVELVSTEAEMLGEGIECTKLKSIPIEINSEDEFTNSYELLTRPESRGVVSNVFCQFAKEAKNGGR